MRSKPKRTIPCTCLACGETFFAQAWKAKKGLAKYCSKKRHPGRIPIPSANRFWKKVLKTETCWLWMGHRQTQGYGTFFANPNNRRILAHRFSWTLAQGSIPEGANVLHRCDNPPCVRPDHLWLGTQADNMRDCKAKRRTRHPMGIYSYQARLTSEKDVLAIREEYTKRRGELARLGRKYGVSQSVVYNVVSRRAYKHISDTQA